MWRFISTAREMSTSLVEIYFHIFMLLAVETDFLFVCHIWRLVSGCAVSVPAPVAADVHTHKHTLCQTHQLCSINTLSRSWSCCLELESRTLSNWLYCRTSQNSDPRFTDKHLFDLFGIMELNNCKHSKINITLMMVWSACLETCGITFVHRPTRHWISQCLLQR